MDRRDLLVLSGALTVSALAGCLENDDDGPDTESPGNGENGTGDGHSGTQSDGGDPSGELDVDDERLAALAAGNAAFALELHNHLVAEDRSNLFLSPYSISMALAMTYAGSSGQTREQMEDVLQFTLEEDTHPAFADMNATLASRETTTDQLEDEEVDAFQLNVANALWGREGFPFATEFLELVEEYYGAGLHETDFVGDPDGERERINEWVADQTEDRIEDLLPPNSLRPQTVLVLTNAIYFMASWLHEFDPAETQEDTFTALDGSESTVPFMYQNVRTRYAEFDAGRAVELPYVGEETSMVLVLPDDGTFEEFETGLDADQLFDIFDALGDSRGDIWMPKFEFETEVQLSAVLAEMGMPAAFSGGFDAMVDGDASGLFIDEIYHDSFIAVDEEGTEAAAATAVAMDESAPPDWDEIRFDRPFLFCIRDRPTDAVLFLGRVVDAEAAQE